MVYFILRLVKDLYDKSVGQAHTITIDLGELWAQHTIKHQSSPEALGIGR